MAVERGTLYTFSGKVAFPGGAPTLLDIAVSLSREGRYAGAGLRFWPVALHCFVVADLLQPVFKFDGLMHDGSECITGDIPKPAKTDAIEVFEDEMMGAIYASLGIYPPDPYVRSAIKKADERTKHGEVYTVGTQALQEFHEPDPVVEDIIRGYVDKYTYADYLEVSGRVPMEFMARFREYRLMLPGSRFK